LEGHVAWISTVAFHPEGKFVAVGVCGNGKEEDGGVDPATKKKKKKKMTEEEEEVSF
jgi:hypothetical protein